MLQVKVDLKAYKNFWLKLCIAHHKYNNTDNMGISDLVRNEFGFDIIAQPQDRMGVVIMDHETFTWFELKWS